MSDWGLKAFQEGFSAATKSLDEPGADVSPHPFGPGSVVETSSGIARVVASMIGARRDAANARQARLEKDLERQKDELTIKKLTQDVVGGQRRTRTVAGQQFDLTDIEGATLAEREAGRRTTAGASGERATPDGVPKNYIPFPRLKAAELDIKGAFQDPDDPDAVWVHPTASGQHAATARSDRTDSRLREQAETREARIRELRDQTLKARSRVSELRALDSQFETQAKNEGDANRKATQAIIDENLQWITRTHGVDAKGKPMPHEEFLKRRVAAAKALGLAPKMDNGDVVELTNEFGKSMYDYDASPAALKALSDKAYQRGYARVSEAVKQKRLAIQAQLQQAAGLLELSERELSQLQSGFQTEQGRMIDAGAGEVDIDAPASEYGDPAEALKAWDDEDEDD